MSSSTDPARLIIAGAASGVGKTVITTGLMVALVARGLRVQGYKVGPDYIDPTYHRAATGRPSYNLDTWLTSQVLVCQRFAAGMRDADMALIEGVMGLFDGRKGTVDSASTAEIARLLNAPVLLVVDVSHMGQSAAAIVAGFQHLDPRVRVAGVILNRVASADHEATLRYAIEQWTGVPLFGAIRRDSLPTLPARHLGLVPAPEAAVEMQALGKSMAETVDIDGIIRLAHSAGSLNVDAHINFSLPDEKSVREQNCRGEMKNRRCIRTPLPTKRFFISPFPPIVDIIPSKISTEEQRHTILSHAVPPPPLRFGIALDHAFSFYYPETLEEFASLGVEVVPFSPLNDHHLPDDIDLFYFGGGYPELFAEQLAENQTMLTGIRSAVQRGVPVYAECGGYMYLGSYCINAASRSHAMLGILPYTFQMGTKRAKLGYREITTARETLLGPAGLCLRGHEFHWSQLQGYEGLLPPPLVGTGLAQSAVPTASDLSLSPPVGTGLAQSAVPTAPDLSLPTAVGGIQKKTDISCRVNMHYLQQHAAYEIAGQEKTLEGYADTTILASYIHIPLAANPHVMTALIHNCLSLRESRNAQGRS